MSSKSIKNSADLETGDDVDNQSDGDGDGDGLDEHSVSISGSSTMTTNDTGRFPVAPTPSRVAELNSCFQPFAAHIAKDTNKRMNQLQKRVETNITTKMAEVERKMLKLSEALKVMSVNQNANVGGVVVANTITNIGKGSMPGVSGTENKNESGVATPSTLLPNPNPQPPKELTMFHQRTRTKTDTKHDTTINLSQQQQAISRKPSPLIIVDCDGVSYSIMHVASESDTHYLKWIVDCVEKKSTIGVHMDRNSQQIAVCRQSYDNVTSQMEALVFTFDFFRNEKKFMLHNWFADSAINKFCLCIEELIFSLYKDTDNTLNDLPTRFYNMIPGRMFAPPKNPPRVKSNSSGTQLFDRQFKCVRAAAHTLKCGQILVDEWLRSNNRDDVDDGVDVDGKTETSLYGASDNVGDDKDDGGITSNTNVDSNSHNNNIPNHNNNHNGIKNSSLNHGKSTVIVLADASRPARSHANVHTSPSPNVPVSTNTSSHPSTLHQAFVYTSPYLRDNMSLADIATSLYTASSMVKKTGAANPLAWSLPSKPWTVNPLTPDEKSILHFVETTKVSLSTKKSGFIKNVVNATLFTPNRDKVAEQYIRGLVDSLISKGFLPFLDI